MNNNMKRIEINEIMIDLIEANRGTHDTELSDIINIRHTLSNAQLINKLKETNLWPSTELDGKRYDLVKSYE